MMRHRWLTAALGAMVLLALLRRSPVEPEVHRVPMKAEPREEQPAPREEPAAPPVAEQPFWDEIGGVLASRPEVGAERSRTSVLEQTANYLGLEKQIFEAASRQALAEIALAWEARDESWLAVAALDGDVRERMEREIQDLYEARKGEALSRLEPVLGESPRARELRGRLDEWIDAAR